MGTPRPNGEDTRHYVESHERSPTARRPAARPGAPGRAPALAITAFAALLSVEAADGPWLAELGA